MLRLILLFALVARCIVASEVERIAWSQSTERFAGLEVEVRQKAGKVLRGSWVSVTDDQFTIKTHRGVQIGSRQNIQTVRAHQRRVRGRVIGAIGGYLLGGSLILLMTGSSEGAQGLPFLLLPALGGVGFWVGREADRNTKTFEFF